MQVPAEYQVIVTALRDLVQSFITNAGAHPGKKREADDNSKKIGTLFWRMNAGELPPEVLDKLRALVSAIQSGNAAEAASIQVRVLVCAFPVEREVFCMLSLQPSIKHAAMPNITVPVRVLW